MHKIKRTAHRSASAGSGLNYNPFGRQPRFAAVKRNGDLEEGPVEARTWPATADTTSEPVHRWQSSPVESTSKESDWPSETTRRDTDVSSAQTNGTAVGNGDIDVAAKRRHNTNLTESKIPEEKEADFARTSDDADSEDSKKREEDERKHRLKKKIPAMQQLKTVLFPHWYTINWLLIAAPVGIALSQVNVNPLAVFIINFIAIIPLAGMLSFATEELALRVGETLGGLLNATFGNAVELIVAIIALVHKEITIVKTSLIGSMLSNLLIVLGMCFFLGGINRLEQFFNITVAQTAASLLALSVGSLLIPTAFTWSVNASQSKLDEELSYGVSIILLVLYGSYLLFQLKSHVELYNEPSKKVAKRKKSKKQQGEASKGIASIGGMAGHAAGGEAMQKHVQHVEEDDEPEEPALSLIGAFVTLALATALIGVCAEFLVDSISEVTCRYHVSETFVGLILLPIVGNAAEHATAVTVAMKDKMDLAIGVAVGSSMQIALLVLPLSVIIGWIIGADMTLVFDNFQIVVLFVAIILVNYLISDGKSHWLEGLQLMLLYIIIAVAAWFYPIRTEGQCPNE